MPVTCYPQPGKAKALRLCEAFAAGVRAEGGEAMVCRTIPARLFDGIPVFYGVRPAWAHLWQQAKAERRDWYFIDNSYFDCVRETQFRVTHNAMQCDGLNAVWEGRGTAAWDARWRALRQEIRPWRHEQRVTSNESLLHVLVCPQSPEFMHTCCGWDGDWLEQAVETLRKHTDRPLRIRQWNRNKGAASATLQQDLAGAWALVTHMSAAAIEALLAGVPVFCTGRGPGRWFGRSDLESIESPVYPGGRDELMALLANNQWTLAELADGTAWRALKASQKRWDRFIATGAHA